MQHWSHGPGTLSFLMVAVGSFLIIVMLNPDSKVGRFDFGFFGVLVEVNMSSCGTMKILYRVTRNVKPLLFF